MKMKTFLLFLAKLILSSIAFILGAVIGGMIVTFIRLQSPPMPEGVDSSRAFLTLMLESPLLVLPLILIGRGLGGGTLSRAATLSFFTWTVYTLNTTIESLAFTTMSAEGALFTTLSFLPPAILCGAVVAWLFRPTEEGMGFLALLTEYFSSRKAGAWAWRLALAALIFVPIYMAFGLLVAPLTSEYFQENMYGLRMPSQEEIFTVLLVRSGLFLLACLPVITLWQRSRLSLFINLGIALFVLVGFLYMLSATYMPLAVRVPHTLEILADSFAHAGLLVLLLGKRHLK